MSNVRYATFDDWLNEPEGHSLRSERLPEGSYVWVLCAWQHGAASREDEIERLTMQRDDLLKLSHLEKDANERMRAELAAANNKISLTMQEKRDTEAEIARLRAELAEAKRRSDCE